MEIPKNYPEPNEKVVLVTISDQTSLLIGSSRVYLKEIKQTGRFGGKQAVSIAIIGPDKVARFKNQPT